MTGQKQVQGASYLNIDGTSCITISTFAIAEEANLYNDCRNCANEQFNSIFGTSPKEMEALKCEVPI